MLNPIQKSILLGTCTTIFVGVCYALIPANTVPVVSIPVAEITNNNDLPAAAPVPVVKTISIQANFGIINHLIKPGESLALIFSKLGMDSQELYKIVNANDLGKQFALITPGKTLRFKTSQAGELQTLSYPNKTTETLIAKRFGDQFKVEKLTKKIDHRIASAQTFIQSSLFLDAKKVGLSDKLIMNLASLYAWDIDFALNLRAGDQFTVLYEKLFIDDQEIDTGDILAAEFVNQGRSYKAVRFLEQQGHAHYYTPEGRSLRKAFLRTPIEFARISSHFNLRRKHPVLNRIRAHKGVDYAANTGTRIKTTGKGVISYRGRKGGYGRVVIVQHGQSYSTLYAHLSKFRRGQQVGSRVNQGDIIGYVGQSGLATGPHLHYEFRVNGKHRNPLTVKLPNDAPINKAKLAAFKEQTQPLLAQLDQVKTMLVASAAPIPE